MQLQWLPLETGRLSRLNDDGAQVAVGQQRRESSCSIRRGLCRLGERMACGCELCGFWSTYHTPERSNAFSAGRYSRGRGQKMFMGRWLWAVGTVMSEGEKCHFGLMVKWKVKLWR